MKVKKLLTLPPYLRVIKTKMMWPFCVSCHINVHPHALVTFVKIDVRIFFITHELFTLHMATKNAFRSL
jgi:hypothetical protein